MSEFDDLRASLTARQRDAFSRAQTIEDRVFGFSQEVFARTSEYRDAFRAMVGKRSGAVVQRLLHKLLVDLIREDVKGTVARTYDGTNEVDNDFSERTQILVPLVTLDLRLSERSGVQAAASIPDVTRSGIVHRGSQTIDFGETFSGLGDTSVVGWYKLTAKNGWFTVVNFGASPTL